MTRSLLITGSSSSFRSRYSWAEMDCPMSRAGNGSALMWYSPSAPPAMVHFAS